MPVTAKVQQPTLGEELRGVARERILRGAMQVLAEAGLGGTVDQVAAAARVGRRTVFRHYATRGALFGAAISEVLATYERNVPPPPDEETSLEAWMLRTAVGYHEMNRRLVGRAFWDIHVLPPDAPDEVFAALDGVPALRRGYATTVAGSAWRAAGGRGGAPSWVVDAFEVQLSVFGTMAMAAYSPPEAGQVSSRILLAVLESAVRRQGARRDGRSTRPRSGRP
jgi:AcrR family transcriptional regulator